MPTQRIMDQKQDLSTWMCLNHPRFVFSTIIFPMLVRSTIKFEYTRAVIGWESVLYKSIEHRVELKLSRHLPNCTMSDHFLVFSLALFSLIKSELSEQARRQKAKEEPNKGL